MGFALVRINFKREREIRTDAVVLQVEETKSPRNGFLHSDRNGERARKVRIGPMVVPCKVVRSV